MLTMIRPSSLETTVTVAPSPTAIVSWNTTAPTGRIDLRIHRADGATSTWLPYVMFTPDMRRSLNGKDDVARIVTDIVQSGGLPIIAIDIRSDVLLDMIAVSTPVHKQRAAAAIISPTLDVPALSQYVDTSPNDRGWCSPATIASCHLQ